ncbi:unnamed protein product (macronuclear) [Paramecium tetraurelia]|uniref:Transmembrane protein n=1 Tax=Paramecium tetraurelia TaxID=5888 RepID=A0CLB0_PARTE|nr:uncharacterized protein GSPATT00008124001 [Paramecium tetraurelia]CAK71577.1 unnamed protein product [Paramecium tetraurelia]|eukprot:XP_001438974.1 hypothetical protein (macronuclear) [Paramecium tetraurelia strain d4-2]
MINYRHHIDDVSQFIHIYFHYRNRVAYYLIGQLIYKFYSSKFEQFLEIYLFTILISLNVRQQNQQMNLSLLSFKPSIEYNLVYNKEKGLIKNAFKYFNIFVIPRLDQTSQSISPIGNIKAKFFSSHLHYSIFHLNISLWNKNQINKQNEDQIIDQQYQQQSSLCFNFFKLKNHSKKELLYKIILQTSQVIIIQLFKNYLGFINNDQYMQYMRKSKNQYLINEQMQLVQYHYLKQISKRLRKLVINVQVKYHIDYAFI